MQEAMLGHGDEHWSTAECQCAQLPRCGAEGDAYQSCLLTAADFEKLLSIAFYPGHGDVSEHAMPSASYSGSDGNLDNDVTPYLCYADRHSQFQSNKLILRVNYLLCR
jgi:hypothetical protein